MRMHPLTQNSSEKFLPLRSGPSTSKASMRFKIDSLSLDVF